MKKRRLTLKGMLKKWFNDNILHRYLQGIDANFIGFFTKKHDYIFENNEKFLQEYERIMKILSSDKYKRFFYKVVNYDAAMPEPVAIKPYGKSFSDRVKNAIAKTYVYLFRRELHNAIILFEKWRHKIKILDEKIDGYMATTTLDERLNRSKTFGIVTEKKVEAVKRLNKIKTKRVEKILENQNA
jgi:hypothetical protein